LCGRLPQYAAAPASGDLKSSPDHLSVLVTLTFDLLTLKLVCNVTRGMENLPDNIGASVIFFIELWANMHQTNRMML